MSSYQTTLARAAAAAAEDAWKRHKMFCPTCDSAARARRLACACAQGTGLLAERAEARARLAAEREADRQPAPGQRTLW